MMTSSELARCLAVTPLFATTSESVRERMVERARRLSLEKGGLLFAQDEPGKELYLVLSGVLEIVRETGGEKLILALVETGGVVGEMALLDAGPRSASARALEATQLLGISQDGFREAIRQEPEVAFEMLRSLAQALRRTTQQAVALAHQDVYQRLVGHLHELCNAHGKRLRGEPGVLLDLPLSETVLGQSIGADPNGVKLLMDLLIFDKLVVRHDGRLLIPDPERLLRDDRRLAAY